MDFTRQSGLINAQELALPITFIGVGGIGSYAVPTLAKMGCSNLTVFDPDRVEPHNIPNQSYGPTDIGQLKVEALKTHIEIATGTKLTTRAELFTAEHSPSGIVISGVDSMAAREVIWQAVKLNPSIPLYMDGRMGGQVLRLFTVNPCDPDDIRWYEKSLHSDAEAVELPCTERAIIYTVAFLAGFIANQVRKYILAQSYPREIIFDAQTLTFVKK